MPAPFPNNRHTRRPRRKLGPTELRGYRDRTFLATHVLTLLATMPPTPDAGTLAARAGWTVDELMPVLGMMERAGDGRALARPPTGRGIVRVMLSASSLADLGLRLAAKGDRWEFHRSSPWDAPVSNALSDRGADLSDSGLLAPGRDGRIGVTRDDPTRA